ncbi:MAG: S8 family serine peptidase [Chloroflexi bacterium]|nr:S8 family serine peptidase [Chloroflexota bacterium]
MPPREPAPILLPPPPSDRSYSEESPVPGRSPKLTSNLDELQRADAIGRLAGRPVTRSRAGSLPGGLAAEAEHGLLYIDDAGSVQVYVDTTSDPEGAVPGLQALGMFIERVSGPRRIVQGRLPISSLAGAAALDTVRAIRPPARPMRQAGAALTPGDAILQASAMRSSFAVDGAGVKVGVLSDGGEGIAAAQASGDLPAIVDVTTCDVIATAPAGQPANTTDAGAGAEGTAMAEIVHDVAPGAAIMIGYFGLNVSTATDLDFMAAVTCLAENNDVVVDDISWFNQGLHDGTSSVSQNAAGALTNPSNRIRGYYTAAGNEAQRHYEGLYQDWAPASSSDNRHTFQGSATTLDVWGLGPAPADLFWIRKNATVIVFLQWDDAWGASSNNYDAFLRRDINGALVASSTGIQSGSQDPVEAFAYTNNTGTDQWFDLEITKTSGIAKNLEFYVIFVGGCNPLGAPSGPCLAYNTYASSVTNNSDASGGVVSLGAIDAADPGNDDIELYSSRGPTNDGRLKPEITGIDGVAVTGAGGFFNPFYGTSAAAPHAAGIAALLLSCNPSLKKGEPGDNPASDRSTLRAALLDSATDLGAAAADNTYGYGRMNALAAAPLAGCAPDADADGIPQFSDNCPSLTNADQTNTDAAPVVTAGIADDITRPNGDGLGDACDADKDNDGLADEVEATLDPAGVNHDLCPAATAPTDPLKLDSDGDRVTDAAECALGTDPASAASKPPVAPLPDADHDGLTDAFEATLGTNPNAVDSDADKVNDGIEFKGYGSSPMVVDTDGDGCSDGREIASVNADKNVNSLDMLTLALNFGTGPRAVLDINQDGKINSIDMLIVAKNFNSIIC